MLDINFIVRLCLTYGLRYKIIDEALAFNESVKYGADVNYNKEFAFKDKYKIIEKTLIDKFNSRRK